MTRDDIIQMAREAGFADSDGVVHPAYQLEAFANLVAEYEREECAKVLLGTDVSRLPDEWRLVVSNIVGGYAKAIRARGNT